MNALAQSDINAMIDIQIKELEDATKIVEWGIWSRGGLPTGGKNVASIANISDDEVLEIEDALRRLRDAMPRAVLVVKKLYIGWKSKSQLAQELRIPRDRVTDYQKQALNALYALICID